MQHMIEASELLRFFDGDQVRRLFHHADGVLGPLGVAAYHAQRLAIALRIDLAKAEALTAQPHLLSQFADAIREIADVFPLPFQHVKGKTSRRLLADAGQFGKLLNQPSKGRRISRHGAGLPRSEVQIADFIMQVSCLIPRVTASDLGA